MRISIEDALSMVLSQLYSNSKSPPFGLPGLKKRLRKLDIVPFEDGLYLKEDIEYFIGLRLSQRKSKQEKQQRKQAEREAYPHTPEGKVERYKSVVGQIMCRAAKSGADNNQLKSVEREWFPKGWRQRVIVMSEEELTELEDGQRLRSVANAQRIAKIAREMIKQKGGE